MATPTARSRSPCPTGYLDDLDDLPTTSGARRRRRHGALGWLSVSVRSRRDAGRPPAVVRSRRRRVRRRSELLGRSGCGSSSCAPTSTNRSAARRGAVAYVHAAVGREGRAVAGRPATNSSSPPTRPSTSTVMILGKPSTTPTLAGCSAASPAARHRVHTGVTVRGSPRPGLGRRDGRGRPRRSVRALDGSRRRAGTSRPASRSTRPARTASRVPAGCSSTRVEGSVSNVVGLPLAETWRCSARNRDPDELASALSGGGC